MAGRRFLTVADELIGCANAVADHLETYGYRLRVEHQVVGYPFTPTFTSDRNRTTLLVEVDSRVDFGRLEDWVRYCRSCTKDIRIAACIPEAESITAADDRRLRGMQVGLFRSGPSGTTEVVPAMDLALQVVLPALNSLHPTLRRLLGPVYEKFDRSEWRDGFKAACQVVETEARSYLIREVRSTRLTFVNTKGNVYVLTEKKIDRMPIGPLAKTFSEIQKPNHADSVIGAVLDLINPERVGATHREHLGKTESKLRSNVGRHMHRLIAALKALRALP